MTVGTAVKALVIATDGGVAAGCEIGRAVQGLFAKVREMRRERVCAALQAAAIGLTAAFCDQLAASPK